MWFGTYKIIRLFNLFKSYLPQKQKTNKSISGADTFAKSKFYCYRSQYFDQRKLVFPPIQK